MRNTRNSCHLTKREIEVLQLLSEGCSNKRIVAKLSLTIRTVKLDIRNIYAKLEICSRFEAIAWVWKQRETKSLLESCTKSEGSC